MPTFALELLSGVTFMSNKKTWLYAKWLSSAGFEVGWRGLTHWNRKLHRQAEEQFYGAARIQSTLKALNYWTVGEVPGCNMIVEWLVTTSKVDLNPKWNLHRISARYKPILMAIWEIDQRRFISLDRGRDPETNKEHIWGSYAGTISRHWGSFADEEGCRERGGFLGVNSRLLPDSTDERKPRAQWSPQLPSA